MAVAELARAALACGVAAGEGRARAVVELAVEVTAVEQTDAVRAARGR